MEMEIVDEEKLDESWIKDFDKIDNVYSKYYKSDIYFVKFTCIYVNKESEIFKIKEENFFLKNPNIISREELIAVLKKNSLLINIRYSLLSLLKFNITIEPEDIKYFLNTDYNLENHITKYMTVLKNIDEIILEKTISMYHDLNNIIIVYYENKLHGDKNGNTTKKIYLHKHLSNHKKTLRK